jgi:HEAT repeat protein
VRLRRLGIAFVTLAVLGPACRAKPTEVTVEELVAQLAGSNEQQVGAARLELIARGEASAAGVASLLGSTDAKVRARAASTLWMLADKGRSAVPALAQAVGDSDVEVRRAAALALGNMGAHAAPAVVPLTHALEDPDGTVRQYAAKALGAIGPAAAAALPSLEELARIDALRADAQEAMRRIRGR